MSLSSESGFMQYKDVRVDGIRIDDPVCNMELCIDLFVLFKEKNENGEPGVHISLPLWKAIKIAEDIKKTIKDYY